MKNEIKKNRFISESEYAVIELKTNSANWLLYICHFESKEIYRLEFSSCIDLCQYIRTNAAHDKVFCYREKNNELLKIAPHYLQQAANVHHKWNERSISALYRMATGAKHSAYTTASQFIGIIFDLYKI